MRTNYDIGCCVGNLINDWAKAGWCRRFAVWANWNGEFVTYTVPPSKPLKVWEGKTASQELEDRAHKTRRFWRRAVMRESGRT